MQTTIKISKEAFSDCTSLTTITIGDNVEKIGEKAFTGTAFEKDANNWENGLLYIGQYLVAADTTTFKTFNIKEGTKDIPESTILQTAILKIEKANINSNRKK